ncbi:MAG: UDP-N-acetylglucosamine--N-acetylmuramyl-(pentapeptide) pyrophosphoryl-undecaprenol N-acetylglucosamine transferase [Patescibacteria group bacterium]
MSIKKILLIGGHPTPAIACIDFLKTSKPDVNIVFLGRKYINIAETENTLEYQEIALDRNIKFIESKALRGLKGLKILQSSVKQSLNILKDEQPDVVLAFGGYISLPIGIACALKNVPFYLHEQTSKAGNANRLMGFFAKKIFVSFPESVQEFALISAIGKKVVYTGNPIRSDIFEVQPPPSFIDSMSSPILFINGGNMGSHAINEHIFNILPKLLLNMSVVHQVGNVKQYGDYEKSGKMKVDLTNKYKHKYHPVTHLNTKDMAAMLQCADLVVCRSGANTFFELIALKKPAILIPLPYSARNEQEYHAQFLADYGVAEIFDQSQSSNLLYDRIMAVLRSMPKLEKSYDKLKKLDIRNAAERIIAEIWQA